MRKSLTSERAPELICAYFATSASLGSPGSTRSPEAVRFCAEKGLGIIQLGDIRELQLPDGRFDLVLATDIIEHVDDDLAALRELRRVLKPGGYLLLTTIPAFHVLWGLQDDVGHHKRRDRLRKLRKRCVS
jgi:SAM-dependent methyltransferase